MTFSDFQISLETCYKQVGRLKDGVRSFRVQGLVFLDFFIIFPFFHFLFFCFSIFSFFFHFFHFLIFLIFWIFDFLSSGVGEGTQRTLFFSSQRLLIRSFVHHRTLDVIPCSSPHRGS